MLTMCFRSSDDQDTVGSSQSKQSTSHEGELFPFLGGGVDRTETLLKCKVTGAHTPQSGFVPIGQRYVAADSNTAQLES